MTNKELEESFKKASTFDPKAPTNFSFHYYEVLGVPIYSEIKKEYFKELLEEYRQQFLRRDNYLNARDCIAYIRDTNFYVGKNNKIPYDSSLKVILKKRLEDTLLNFIIIDNRLDEEERKIINEKGKEYGFKESEIDTLVNELKKIHGFTTIDSKDSTTKSTSTTTAGYPKLEIHNNITFKQKGEFIFDNVKLTETRREVITIKNGGGGTLDASAIWSKKWIEVVPKKIHQSNLPQDVTIIINPSKDPSLKNGAATMDTLNLRYASGSNTVNVPINIKLSIEGHHSLVKRLSGYAALIAGAIAFFTLIYIFNINHFSGWAIFGFVVSAIAIGIGLIAGNEESDKNILFLYIIPGEIILLITSLTVFLLFLTITITWFVSKLIFEKYTFRNELIFVIPICTFLLFLAFFLGGSNLNYYSGNFNSYRINKNTTSKSVSKPPVTSSNPVVSKTEAIGRTGYISADEFANIRNGASVNSGIITKKNRGETVYVMEKDLTSGWYKISYTDKENVTHYGYVSNKLISFNFVPKTSILDGKWICVSSYMETEGLVVLFSDNVGTVYSLPTERKSNRTVRQVLWKDFRPEQKWLNVYVPLSGGYLNNEVTFKDSNNTIRFMNGDVYKRLQESSSSQNESNNYKPPAQVNPVIDNDNSKQENSTQVSTLEKEVQLSQDNNFISESGKFRDSRDGYVYKWIKIGTQIWMAENLAFLPSVNPSSIESNNTPCYYISGYQGINIREAKSTSKYNVYGVLYNWSAALVACPVGWHLPSDDEWKTLEIAQGMYKSEVDITGYRGSGVGSKLASNANLWVSGYLEKDRDFGISGFSALPGASRADHGGSFGVIGHDGYWWSATETNENDAWYRSLGCNTTSIGRKQLSKAFGCSVRCVKD